MKKVFSSHKQLAHVWAQQTQESGRASRMFFSNTTDIYSYGRHYMAAKIHTLDDGKKVCLIRSDSYSHSTSGHLSEIQDAVRGLMPSFRVPDIHSLRSESNLKYFTSEIEAEITIAKKCIKVESNRVIRMKLKNLDSTVYSANQFFKFAGYPKFIPSDQTVSEVIGHLKTRLARYKELNTPEMIKKRERDKARREQLENQKLAVKNEEKILKFRQGEYIAGIKNPFEYLRIKGDTVQTSRGASVPLIDAKRLFMFISNSANAEALKGLKVGHFTLESVSRLDDGDTLLVIGCHRILMSEAIKLFATPTIGGGASLTLVQP
jgi:hypothetical protein